MLRHLVRPSLALGFLVAASVAPADALVDLHAALAKLPATGALSATVDARSTSLATATTSRDRPACASV